MALLVAPHRPAGAAALPLPTVLHIGSGKNFRSEWLNLDIEPRWRPDVLFDLATKLQPGQRVTLPSQRFGAVTLAEETFDEVVAQDVLEHIPDLVTAMTNILGWLKTGGVLHAAVPYDLSLGAWSDPTHVRGFNERSFEYYTNWSWYLGWRTHHFHLQKLDLVPSDFGRTLVQAGMPTAEILRTPRAIDQIQVQLQKRALDAAARQTTAHYLERPLL